MTRPLVRVVTINILCDLSRWAKRRSLLVQGLAELQPDLIALQEVVLSSWGNTAQWRADQLTRRDDPLGRPYAVYLCPKTGDENHTEAIAILSRLPVHNTATLDLRSQNRVAQIVKVTAAGCPLVVASGHLFWGPGEAAERVQQVQRLLDWLAEVAGDAAIVACGDFNGTPESAAIRLMREGLASAHAARHGREPEYTCPTPLPHGGPVRALRHFIRNLLTAHTLRPWRGTLDYIFVSERVRVIDCAVVLNRPAPHDPKLYPSDHFGLAATLQLD